jgi:alginate O-acetyltransferase complex protein AlgI
MNFVIKPELQNAWLCLTSLLFYFWDETSYIIIMIISISINYCGALGMVYWRTKMDESKCRRVLAASVSGNLILLFFFKYTSFLMEIVNIITLQRIKPILNAPSVHLPLGISFFTFHGLSYIIDVYRNEAEVERNPVTLALYFSFFPQLIAGPIVRYRDVAQQLIENRKFNRKEFAQGVVQFTLGLSKKMLIANTVGAVADSIFTLPLEKIDAPLAWVSLLTYTLQIYFDFSGYSDMAIGLAHIFGIGLPENFNYPYVSRSIREFWRRWHISLSNWFRDYLYISLGGNRVSKRRLHLNLLTVFFLCGLWHGASWNFIIWGLYHGLFLVLERSTIFIVVLRKIPRVLQHLYALTIISIGWVFFRAPTVKYSIGFIRILYGLQIRHSRVSIPVKRYIDTKIIVVIIFAICGSSGLLPAFIRVLKDIPNRFSNKCAKFVANSVLSFLWIVTFVSLFLLSIIDISSGLYNPFIYFRF